MLVKPTINDFLDCIDWHISKADGRVRAEVSAMRRKAAAVGMLNSGNTIARCVETVRSEFNSGVETVLGELKRAIRKTKLDHEELRRHTGERLVNFATAAKATAQIPEASGVSLGVDEYISEQCAALDSHLDLVLRQFDSGFFDPAEPEIPPMAHNYINIAGNMTGSTIAQESPGAKQSVEFNLNIGAINEALTEFETAIASTSLPSKTLDELRADISTIRAQLGKSTPNKGIIQEAGKSLRNVVEGIVGEMLAEPVTAAAMMLWSALGIG